MAHMEANQDTTDIWSNLLDGSEIVFNPLEQEERPDDLLEEGAQHGKAGAQISISPGVSAMAIVEANQYTSDIFSNLLEDFNLLEQNETSDINMEDLLDEEDVDLREIFYGEDDEESMSGNMYDVFHSLRKPLND